MCVAPVRGRTRLLCVVASARSNNKKRKRKRDANRRRNPKRAAANKPKASSQTPWRGTVVQVTSRLFDEGRKDDVLEVVSKLQCEVDTLKRMIADSQRRAAHKSDERVSTEQLQLQLDALQAALQTQSDDERDTDGERDQADQTLDDAAQMQKRKDRNKSSGRPRGPKKPPGHLRRIPVCIPVPPSERNCEQCGADRQVVGERRSDVIELIPAELVVYEEHRPTLQCACCDACASTVPTGPRVVEGGRFGPNLVANILVDKYDRGLPLHRQQSQYAHMGLTLNVSTMADQVKWAAELLQPIWRLCERTVLDADVMQLDGTGLKVLDPNTEAGKRLGTLWGYVGDGDTALYLYSSSGHKTGQRPGDCGPEDFLKRRKGLTVADAASVFDASFARDDLIECGCNMHARRYFVRALDSGDKRAARPLRAFKKLYAIEDELRGGSVDLITAGRQEHAKPVYQALLKWAQVYQPHVEPQSPMGRAIGYLLNHQLALTRYLDDGRIPPDNGAPERLHVRAAMTRKNFLFAGSDEGARRAAVLYTVLGCCRLCGIDPVQYLADVLARLQGKVVEAELADLLPARWNNLQAAA